MEISNWGSPPLQHGGDIAGCFGSAQGWVRALESSLAERLQDLARNSMDSVGVSGGAQFTAEDGGRLSNFSCKAGDRHYQELVEDDDK